MLMKKHFKHISSTRDGYNKAQDLQSIRQNHHISYHISTLSHEPHFCFKFIDNLPVLSRFILMQIKYLNYPRLSKQITLPIKQQYIKTNCTWTITNTHVQDYYSYN